MAVKYVSTTHFSHTQQIRRVLNIIYLAAHKFERTFCPSCFKFAQQLQDMAPQNGASSSWRFSSVCEHFMQSDDGIDVKSFDYVMLLSFNLLAR
jgi:hypothetical protein